MGDVPTIIDSPPQKAAGATPQRQHRRKARALEVGREDDFILAWGRSQAALRGKNVQLLVSCLLNLGLGAALAVVVWHADRREPIVFVRDHLGNVIQADAQSFLHAGDARDDAEITGFVRRWVLDAWSWTPVDVEDRLKACLELVDGKAHPAIKSGLRLADRQRLVDAGVSGRVHDDHSTGREPQVAILKRTPYLEVMVSFEHFGVAKDGGLLDFGHFFTRVALKQVPRSARNPSGLIIVDAQISQKL